MTPNPVLAIRHKHVELSQQESQRARSPSWTIPLTITSIVLALVWNLQWPRRWLYSGCAAETLLAVYAEYGPGNRIFPSIPLWTILATLNLGYAVCSTSWLLYGAFTALCYPCIFLTCLFQFEWAADQARRALRNALREIHFTRDKIAFFNLPALEIDTEVDGLMVIRGFTLSLSSLTILVHGVEVGIKLADDIELALYTDVVTIPLFRSIQIGDVFANVKGGKGAMTFGELGETVDDEASDDAVFVEHTPLLRAATFGSKTYNERPKLRVSMTAGSFIKDSSAQASWEGVTTINADDEKAEKKYTEVLTEIRTTSAVYQARAAARQALSGEHAIRPDNDKDWRAAICAELQNLPSVPHPPERSVRVTTLQNLSPPYVRRFLHRLPFLYRLLLSPIGYFHPVSIASINAAGSGEWLSALLSEKIFKHYSDDNAALRRLQRRISQWLVNASFCLQLADMDGVGQVPLSTYSDIVSYMSFGDIIAYRTQLESKSMAEVVRLGGADATIAIPAFLLPHHEHVLPPRPTPEDEEELAVKIDNADGKPQTVLAEKELHRTKKDETTMKISVHGNLPAAFDQSLLNFVAALVKATKIIELEKEVDEVEQATPQPPPPVDPDMTSPLSRASTLNYDSDASSTFSLSPTKSSAKDGGLKNLARVMRQGLKDVNAGQSIREFAKDLHQSTRDGMKKVLVGGIVNDRWIAKMVGKVAAKLEEAQGSLGYSGDVPISLEPYRPKEEMPSKLLP